MTGKRLIIFAREPLPGRVKTRLASSVGDETAAGLYDSMLKSVLDLSRQLVEIETVVFWECEEESLPLLAKRYQCLSRLQSGGDIGQRMLAAFEEMFDEGAVACCLIGSDAPDLPQSYIVSAFDALSAGKADVVFGPCHDGGYYLLGLTRLCPQLFAGIDWSTPVVLGQSLTRAEGAALRAVLLPEWWDIDTCDDFERYLERKNAGSQI